MLFPRCYNLANLMRSSFTLLLCLLPVCSNAQQAPSLDELLPRLYAYAREYRAKLPSLSCDESITSQTVRNGKVEKEVKIEATLRVIRDDAKAGHSTEILAYKKINGRRPRPHFTIPYLVQGGFANAVGFAREDNMDCFDYRLVSQDGGTTLRLDMTLKPDQAVPHCIELPGNYRKTVLVDAGTGRITHVERTISPESAKQEKQAYFFSTDYRPQKLGGETFWLPAKVYAHDADDQLRMYATYSNFHRYTGELKVLPNDKQPDEVR